MENLKTVISSALLVLVSVVQSAVAEECGEQANFDLCPDGLCCSQYGWCGNTDPYCGGGCQSQCGSSSPSSGGIASVISEDMYNQLFPNRNAIYTYQNFVEAGNSYPTIGTEGSREQQLREIAAFAAHVQQETAGLFFIREIDQSSDYCDGTNQQYPCAWGQKYFGRGPLQLSWNYNYGAARDSGIGADILANPDIVAQNAVIAFRSSFWFWTRSDWNIPSIHDVMVGKWNPSQSDINADRRAGFGQTINIINGGIECGKWNQNANNRVQFYRNFCATLSVDPGENLDCTNSAPY
ncbi:hypothetical protein Mapa_018546 [Marchantia paleacea]|nr:hypothetical protein Mapa_018546 [Marchantia paleacea]